MLGNCTTLGLTFLCSTKDTSEIFLTANSIFNVTMMSVNLRLLNSRKFEVNFLALDNFNDSP